MTDSNQPEATLTFEDSKYAMADLPEEAKKLVAGLKISEAQIRFQQDNLKLLTVARSGLASQLKVAIKDVTPIDSWLNNLFFMSPLRALFFALIYFHSLF